MNFQGHLLSFLLFSPFIGIPLLPLARGRRSLWGVGIFSSLIPFVLTIGLFLRFQATGGFEFQEEVLWIPGFQVFYRLGVDGLSLPLVGLTTFLLPIIFFASHKEVNQKIPAFLLLFLLLEVGMLGVFLSLDLFLFYVFWEVMLIPMYFLIGVWGGSRRIYAAMKFVIYTMLGSLLMLAAILYLYLAGGKSFNLLQLYGLTLPLKVQVVLFLAFAIAFAIKIPLFPFHTWLPDAHVEAPTGGSVILAGVLLKMGTYGFVRFAMPLFPQATQMMAPVLLGLSVIGILYGALVSMVQPDLKKLVAYSSVSHLGFVMLGLTSLTHQGVAGATLQMVNHGISTGALFLLVGMLYERRHTREIASFGGLASTMPLYTFFFMVVTLSSLGLPGTNGFVGEFLILLGTFKKYPIVAGLAGIGVILAAVYLLWMIRRIFFGTLSEENRQLPDLSLREASVLIPIVLVIFWIGLFPGYFLNKMNPAVEKFLERGMVVTHGIARTG